MRFPLLAFLFFSAAQLYAQNPVTGTVRPGIKSVTHKICGYSRYGDSTKLLLNEEWHYDAKGRLTMNVDRNFNIAIDAGPEQSVTSWFYELNSLGRETTFDTVRYKYDAAGKPVQEKSRYRNRSYRTQYTYDVKGNCVKEQHYGDGKLRTEYFYKYDSAGHWIRYSSQDVGEKVVVINRRTYDRQGRLTGIYSGNGKDSVIFHYTDAGHTSTEYRSYGTFERRTYDRRDSLVSEADYSYDKYVPGRFTLRDSTHIVRDSSGRKVSFYSEGWYGGIIRCYETYANGLPAMRIVVESGDTIASMTWRYEGGKCVEHQYHREKGLYEQVLYFYNEKGDRVEERLYDGAGRLVQREVYTYTYY